MNNLDYFYSNTIYYIEHPAFTLRIGKINVAWENFCSRHSIDSYFLITPYNPQSELISDEKNRERLDDFKNTLKQDNEEFFPYRTIDPRGGWPDEHGCVILNLSSEEAFAYANKYNQNAFAKAKRGEGLELQWLI